MKSIVFMGTPPYAVRILKELVDKNFLIQALLTQKDKKVGRKQILTPSAVKSFALKYLPNVPIITPTSLKDEELRQQLCGLRPDFIVVAAYGKIVPKSILNIAPCINLHASLLPKYRGASPIQSAILNGDETSGVCTMLMNEGLDTGDILQSVEYPIKNKNATELFELFGDLAAKLCVDTLLHFDSIYPVVQDENQATFCKKIKKEDGLVNLEVQGAKEIYQKFLAFSSWPGIFLANGLKLIDIEIVDVLEYRQAKKIVALEKQSFLLGCKQGILRIKKVQESGKKILDARTFLNGKRLKNADFLY
ncbi:methionyl-tRNA formyltransferase [Campylobacter sp. MIT 21-1685]|uniref:methionyl-tRNA formyltransferase n=1 Tax=unclassified Campylobacter TaxID=2593542 RepID=UPI00224A9553|nr:MULTISPECIES: methionyl-tRNA formyltransferase [unclassified Campylobacter]MCX2683342.1 methionyl-tRNA formyltransferase [Campylobacter sp. MIT 21-1684]MCX2751603.1 methionyl-tRNA formyltransferase [Campylobacter sp. MIT 21-1682]MCX2807802.1 methionyl-tRNA formyltransferase [Campylobacter sp. MIT 21-1685]